MIAITGVLTRFEVLSGLLKKIVRWDISYPFLFLVLLYCLRGENNSIVHMLRLMALSSDTLFW